MYVNKIDEIIGNILDILYFNGLEKDPTYKTIIDGKINFVEYRDSINDFVKLFMDSIDITPIQEIINNKENIVQVINIIGRYVWYYYFLSIAYHYTGTDKNFRNNLIQYAYIQEKSSTSVKGFFDTDNNSQLIKLFNVVKNSSKLLLMTDLQKKTVVGSNYVDAIKFLNRVGLDDINNYLLKIDDTSEDKMVTVNVHNLIKFVVIYEIYIDQDRNLVFEILNEIEESEQEYIYIDVIISNEDVNNLETYQEIFVGDDNSDQLAKNMYDIVSEYLKINSSQSAESKNNSLFNFNMITPVVDDFLRYHKDSEKIESAVEKPVELPVTTNNAKNIQMALLYQQRKQKDNTRANLIVNKIDIISDLYSENVKSNKTTEESIIKYFENPFSHRKAVLHNYNDELYVVDKIHKQGRKAIEDNAHYFELMNIITNAYFNFKDFKKYGTTATIISELPIIMIRYSNIENRHYSPTLHIETRTAVFDDNVNVVGLSIGPFNDEPVQCTRIEDMIDIRDVDFYYNKNGKILSKNDKNGYKMMIKMIKYYYINTITVKLGSEFEIYNDFTEINKLNSKLTNKMIFWIYDPDLDTYAIDTYEKVQLQNILEKIKFMNASIYDKIINMLKEKLVNIVSAHISSDMFTITKIIETYSKLCNLDLSNEEKHNIIIKHYLKKLNIDKSEIKDINEYVKIEKPKLITFEDLSTYRIKIDTVNPTNVKMYVKLEAYSKNKSDSQLAYKNTKCQHESEWAEVSKLKTSNLNKYNIAVTQFMEKFAIETKELDYVCKTCGQVIPLKQYVQDGSFDNNTQRFITSYVPIDQDLADIKEYEKYKLIINFLDMLLDKVSFITSTNMLVGSNITIKQKRKAIVKNIIDLVLKHNSVNIEKKQSEHDRMNFFSKKFNINRDLDIIYFFELDDSIINFKSIPSSKNEGINKLKFNNLLLYFITLFLTELNGTQITLMAFDNIGNIYTYLKFGSKLFGDLLIKKNINDMETVPITNYPVLCYLLFIVSYFLIKFKLWYDTQSTQATQDSEVKKKNTFNPFIQKIIITSFVDLFNSISIDAGNHEYDHVYTLISSKLYTKLNSTFKDNEIFELLKASQIRFSGKMNERASVPMKLDKDKVKTLLVSSVHPYMYKTRKIPSYKISSGIMFYKMGTMVYNYTENITDLTNCANGAYYNWVPKGTEIYAVNCNNIKGSDVEGEQIRLNECYYYNLNIIANRRCLTGNVHDFQGKQGNFVCSICGKKSDIQYSTEELNLLSDNLILLENVNAEKTFERQSNEKKQYDLEIEQQDNAKYSLIENFNKVTNNKPYGQLDNQVRNFIKKMEMFIDPYTNIDIDKYPVLLNDDVYVIDHMYNGTPYDKPIIFTQKDNRVYFKENDNHYKTDVYYYNDNQKNVEVYYHAVTLKLLGHREKHREFVDNKNLNNYLIISASIRNRLTTIGYETKYIDISDTMEAAKTTNDDINEQFYLLLDGLMRNHVFKSKSIVDKIISIISKIKFYQPPKESDTQAYVLKSTQAINNIVSKYAKLLPKLYMGENNNIFDDWSDLRNNFDYEQVNWIETNIVATGSTTINSETINYYDKTSNSIFYYLFTKLTQLIDINEEHNSKINIVQMFIEIIVYIYSSYNIDTYKNCTELKRFVYILNGSELMIDVMRTGQGLDKSKKIESELENESEYDIETPDTDRELEDIKEEAEALDVEFDYYAEEDEDYAQEGEYAD